MELDDLYTSYKPLLQSIAYRMLGSITDAEDMVQDIFVTMQHVPVEDVRHIKAYLVKMITNRCLNTLKSAKRKREVYVGPWLPEPVIQELIPSGSPEEQVVREETVSFAMLVMLQQLSPMERVVFLLREVLAYDYGEIAEMLDKSEANCRKIYSRAKPKIERLHGEEHVSTEASSSDRFVSAFVQASRSGNFEPFVQLLVEHATLVSDGGGKVRAAIYPIQGRLRIQAFLEGIYGKGTFAAELRPVRINGDAGLLVIREGILHMAICFGGASTSSGMAEQVYFILNPDKLQHIR
ncbi:RNA polymerase sigma-70 factor [Paenibacillus rigui]|uniref:RNA polymerase sigma-70 factor n=1 Tax=Paenibacillus rigui TaxID=554312 RepID=A0A229UR94_9BACL|nr:RNA polymerase sigma-70 factor [Paenibacillus rigui]OXM85833.1 RNA polymerase sigma-70 factor [Paenibacillus rigui]